MAQLQVGDVLEGRYQIDHPIARGGMSTVYRCVDLRLGRAVAVKVMDDRYVDDPVFRQRFRREARAMARINHPHIVGVYDFGSDGHHVFLVMELITGGTLRELIAERGPMPPHAALAVMRAVLTGLAAAHRDGLIHRDVKPDNVLISADRAVKIADFGLVRATDSEQHTTAHIVGTAAYLSPEQVRGTELGPASDVYSAGVLLFELLTGETPFTGATDLDRAYQRLERSVPAPSSVIEGVPPEIDALVAQATRRDPAERYADATAFLEAVEATVSALSLPGFTVPVPRNSAAHRAAAVPTDTSSLPTEMMSTGVISPPPEPEDRTSVLPEAASPPPATTAAPAPQGSVQPPAPAAPSPARPPEPRMPAYSNRSPVRLAAWITVVLLLIGAVALGGWWLGSGRYGEIPEIIGSERIQALAQVEEAGFEATSRGVYSDDVAEDRVVDTDPPGRRAVRGSEVTLLVSQGRPTVPAIPEEAEVERYEQLLSERTLRAEVAERRYSDDVPAGGVIGTRPAAGEAVDTGSTVALTVSKGPAPVRVPDVSGMSEEEARTTLSAAGLEVSGVDWEYSPEHDRGEAAATVPEARSEAARGDGVRLVLSTARTVPDLSGMTTEEAAAALTEAGLSLASVERDEQATGGAGEVERSEPRAGSRVDPEAEAVTLYLPGRVSTPLLLGKTVSEAERIVEDQGLTLDAGRSASGNARILTQSPLPGKTLSLGSPVTVTALG